MIEHDRTGILVPPSDEDALADAIQQLLMDPSRAAQLGKAARDHVKEVFTQEQQLDCLTAILANGFRLPRSGTEATASYTSRADPE